MPVIMDCTEMLHARDTSLDYSAADVSHHRVEYVGATRLGSSS